MIKQANSNSRSPITTSSQAADFIREDLLSLDHEESWILLLTAARLPLVKKMITAGTLTTTQIDHRRILKEAILADAAAIILFHNHPSGIPLPSAADIRETDRLRQACSIFDISLLDHIIISDERYYSFADESQRKF